MLVVKHKLLRILDLVNVPCEILVEETLTLTSVTVCIDLLSGNGKCCFQKNCC